MLIERQIVGGGGATRLSGGIVRVYDPDLDLTRLTRNAMEHWLNWTFPGAAPFTPCGALYLLEEDGRCGEVLAVVQAMTTAAYPMECLTGYQARERFPWLKLPGRSLERTRVVFEPRGGHCDPRSVARAYMEQARKFGSMVVEGVAVRRVIEQASRAQVQLGDAMLDARVAVIACGAASRSLVPGLDVHVRTIPISYMSVPCAMRSSPMCVVDALTGGYCRPFNHFSCLIGGGPHRELTSDDTPQLSCEAHEVHAGIYRDLFAEEATVLGGAVGMDLYTASKRPLIGFLSEHSSIYLLTGLSGRGAKYIPHVAKTAARAISSRLRPR
jgi:glycine/D-amino acid oxidase-like deaminating enzyme